MTLPQATLTDYLVIAGFMAMLILVGFVFSQFTKNASEYFVGANKVAWWMAGASLFMGSFSANTFTGAMGLAYEHGLTGLLITWSFVTGLGFAFFYTAARYRQTRSITPVDLVRERFGPATERIFALVGLPASILCAAIWLYGLSIFVSTVVQIDTRWVILLTGAVILLYSTLGGTVAVQAADFMQAMVLLPITIIFAVVVLMQDKVGGVSGLIAKLPPSHLNPINATHTLPWLIVWHIQGLFLCSGCSPRFLAVRDGRAARKVALFAALLFLVGPIFWYVPALACKIYYPDLAQALPGLSKPAEGAYAIMALRLLPHGLVGLMVAAMFAATMSSMDSAFNSNAGVFVINVYKGWLRKQAGHREQVLVGRLANVVFGVLVLTVAWYYSTLKKLGVFDITIAVVSAILYPMALPSLLMLFFRKTPRWTALASAMCGMAVGLIGQAALIPPLAWLGRAVAALVPALHLPAFLAQQPWSFPVQSLAVLLTVTLVFAFSSLFWGRTPEADQRQIGAFYEQMETPVDVAREVEGNEDHRFLMRIGVFVLCIGAGILLLLADPSHSVADRLVVAATGLTTAAIGLIMLLVGRRSLNRALLGIKAAPDEARAKDLTHVGR